MKKKSSKLSFKFMLMSVLPLMVLALMVMISCSSSNSVREIRASRNPNWGFTPDPIRIKKTVTKDDALVKGLFMQSKRSSIELPHVDGTGAKGIAIISEQVTYTNAEVIRNPSKDNKTTDLNEVQHLNEVVVTAKSRFTPEQNGKVNVDFVVRVPKELLSQQFRVTLAPKLLHNDSVVPLKSVVVKGKEFSDKQKQSYLDYDAYEKSIVDESLYDSVFVDHKGVKDDIAFQQNFYYKQYHKEWSRQTDFEEWKSAKDDAEALQEAKRTAYDKKIYYEHVRKAREKALKEVAKGKDTTGLFAKLMKGVPRPGDLKKGKEIVEQKNDYRLDFYREYSKKAQDQVMRDWAMGKDTVGAFARYMTSFDKNMKTLILDGDDIKDIPERFRDIYKEGRKMKQIKNQAVTEEDSVEIAQSHYKFEDIAINEMKKERLEEKRNEIIAFPYETNTRLDSVIQTDREFVYYYKQDYPVTPGMKRLRLTINTTVDATDRSQYIQPQSDTLSYFISSLSQLVDSSLVTKKTTVHRDVFNSMVMYPKFTPGKAIFNINYNDNKEQVDKVLDTYKTFANEGKLNMDSVVIRVSTALDGSYDKNVELSMKRAEALKSYFVKALGGASSGVDVVFKTRFNGEDWNTLAKLISRRTDLTNQSEILDMLTQAVYPDKTEEELKKAYPQDFRIIRDSIYPLLNKAEITFNMSRPGMDSDVMINTETRSDYAEALKYLQNREYWKALDILSNYPDYNTALCLVCMGYNAKALELLGQLKETGNTEYLKAILAVRAGDQRKAVSYLLKACEMDPTKAYRAPLDPEIAELVRRYNLKKRLNNLEFSSDLPLTDAERMQ